MRRKAAEILSVFCIIFFLISSAYAEKTFLWKVQSKTTTVYILGSIHFMKKEMYPLNKKIEDAFDKSQILAVEANVNDVSKIDIQKLLETAFYTGNDTLENHVSKETYELVKREFEGLGFPILVINKQKPWILALTLTSLELAKSGYDPEYGIDIHFLSEASGRKEIKELESIDYQINLLSGFSDMDQEAFLLYTLKDLNSLDTEVDQLIRTWKTGDAKGMESLLIKSLHEDQKLTLVYGKLLYERNRNMVSKIEGFLKTAETYFVIVGAGHLVGDKGIIEMLRKKGYLVEQI
jgi:uncharacterized protein YbaP (TraB family)